MFLIDIVKRLPGVKYILRISRPVFFRGREFGATLPLRFGGPSLPARPQRPKVVISLTSFPDRIRHVWLVVETLLRQDRKADVIVLVLAECQFPGRKLPRRLQMQQQRGLEIMWVAEDLRSYKKLIPVRAAYPDATIVTVDDDVLYKPWMLSRLLAAANVHPEAIIGHRGRQIRKNGDMVAPYITWKPAGLTTSPAQSFLTGIGGILYPAHILPIDELIDVKKAMQLCPTGDDIWLWALSRKNNVPVICLGEDSYRDLWAQSRTPALCDVNWHQGQNDRQIAAVMEEFGLRKSWF